MKITNLARLLIAPVVVATALCSLSAIAQTSNSSPFQLGIYSPTNGQVYQGPTNVGIYVRAGDSNVVRTVAYFSGARLIGTVTNTGSSNLFYYNWTGVGAGSYGLTVVGTDSAGNTATSSVVNVSVVTNLPPVPFAVGWYSPANGQTFIAPASVALHASVTDSNVVRTMQYFVGSTLLATVTNTGNVPFTNTSSGNPFTYTWTNVATGSYTFTAVATDVTGATATSAPVTISVQTSRVHPTVAFDQFLNGKAYLNPSNVALSGFADESGSTIQWIEIFAGSTLLTTVTNPTYQTDRVTIPFYFNYAWPNPAPGNYALTAVAMDAQGNVGTSSVVNISILGNPPPVPFAAGWLLPADGQQYTAPASLGIHAWVCDSNTVTTMQYFANSSLIATFTNNFGVLLTNVGADPYNLFGTGWYNVPAGTYVLTAVATDTTGATATSAPITIYVHGTNLPPVVRIVSPPNAASFRSPVDIPIYAYAIDPDGYVLSVEFFAGTNDLGRGIRIVPGTNAPPTTTRSNYFFTVWSNAPAGTYALIAKGTDNSNAVTVSPPVNIAVLGPVTRPTNPIPIVSISAIDPVAIEGTNCWVWSGLSNAAPNWSNWVGRTPVPFTNCGPKNATFRVDHSGDTNNPLTVNYSIGGTASNGVAYVTLPGYVTIPAGERSAMISVVPIDDGPPDVRSTVILTLAPSTTLPPVYTLGSQAVAEAVILDSPPTAPAQTPTALALPDRTFHLSASGPNGAWFHVEASTDMQTWTPICTNQVVNGSIDFADPDASSAAGKFYRAIPEANAPQ